VSHIFGWMPRAEMSRTTAGVQPEKWDTLNPWGKCPTPAVSSGGAGRVKEVDPNLQRSLRTAA